MAAPITLPQIKAALAACQSGKTFTIPATFLGSATLKSVFGQSLPDNHLVVTGALSETAVSVVVTGVGTNAFATMAVTATFTPAGDDVALVVVGTSNGSWGFGVAFPSLAKQTLAGAQVQSGATLTLSTLAQASRPAGLAFSGHINIAGAFSQVASLLGGIASLPFAGAITFTGGVPAFQIATPSAAPPFSLGPLKSVSFGIVLGAKPIATTSASGAKTMTCVATMTLVSTFDLKLNGVALVLPATLDFTGGPSMAIADLVIAPSKSAPLSLADLAEFAGGADLTSLMPPTHLLDWTKSLTLDSIVFTLTLSKPRLVSTKFSLSTSATWSIDSKIAIEGASFRLTLSFPKSGGQTTAAMASATLALPANGSICTLDLDATAPGFTFAGELDPKSKTPNVAALAGYFLPGVDLPTIDLTSLEFSIAPSTSTYSFSAGFVSDWTLSIGIATLSITNVNIALAKAGSAISGSVDGTLLFDQTDKLDVAYTLPGNLKISAAFPSISLSRLVGVLLQPAHVTPPGFDFNLIDSTILIEKTGQDYNFQLATELDQYGTAALMVRKVAGAWGYSFGIDLNVGKLAGLPGLGLLSAIDKAFGLDEVIVLVSSVADATFTFPNLAAFNNPKVKSKTISSPGWTGGVVAGLNIFAELDLSKSAALGPLCKLVGFKGTFATSLSIPTDPASGTVLKAILSGTVNSNASLQAALEAELLGTELKLGLTGTFPTSIAGQHLTFTIAAFFDEDAVFLSGSTPDTITFADVVSLGGLALELGIDAEGIPSFGVAASIMIESFDSSIAIFFDSGAPANSMFVGSISDTPLIEIMSPLAGVALTAMPQPVQALLDKFMLRGTASFTTDASLATALNAHNATPVIAAFAAKSISITNDPHAITILGGNGVWAVIDLANETHYHLSTSGNTITVKKEAQVKFVPQPTQIANLPIVQAGFALSGEIDVFGLTGIVDIDIELKSGISIAASLSPLEIMGGKLLSLTDATNATKGPFLSLSSYTKNGQPPHATATGKLGVLGLVGASIVVTISESGAAFELKGSSPVFSYDIKGQISGLTNVSCSGTLSIGVDQTLDLGLLGKIPVDLQVGGSLKAGLSGPTASAGFSGKFSFAGVGFSVGPVSLAIDGASLQNLPKTIVADVLGAIQSYLTDKLDPTRWLNWVKNNIIPGIINNASQVGQVLSQTFKQTPDQIANASKQVLGYGADAAAQALNGAKVGADDVAKELSKVGYAANDVTNAIAHAFHGVHADVGGVHFDTPGGPHADTTPHVDTPAGPHADTRTPPHGDTAPHVDTPAGPHVDTQTPPHGDTSPHVDTPGVHGDIGGNHADSHQDVFGHGVHEDFGTPHADGQVPPHGDTHAHIDTPAGPHVDTQTPPHGDTHAHVDTPAGPHVDGPVPPHADTKGLHVDAKVPPHGDQSEHVDVKT